MKNIILIGLLIVLSFFQLHAKDFVSQEQIEKYEEQYGKLAAQRLSNWNSLLKINQNKSKILQARNIDKYFNQYRYKYDIRFDDDGKSFRSDYLRSFKDFIGKYGGDCDDYAIMKYYSLLQLGVPENKLQIWVGGYKSKTINHAVLAYFLDNRKDPLILDSNTRWAVRFSKRTNFTPWLYANSNSYGVFKKTLKRYGKSKELYKYDSNAEFLMLKIYKWLGKDSSID